MFTWIKRMAFFLVTNFLIILTIGIIMRVTGLDLYLQEHGGTYGGLMVFCFLFGMIGSFISLWMSKWAAKRAYGVQILDQNDPEWGPFVNRVHNLAKSAGLSTMPEVGVYQSPELNAFATGPSKNNSLVAVSTGLLNRMNENEVEGVLAHEVAHIANGDMVTMTLIQGVVNAFVMFLANIITNIIAQALRGDRESRGSFMGNYFIYMIVQSIIGLFGMMVVATFSRWREFRADKGGAKLAGTGNMIAALQALQRNIGIQDPVPDKGRSLNSLKISTQGGIMSFLSTHPPLEKRIKALEQSY